MPRAVLRIKDVAVHYATALLSSSSYSPLIWLRMACGTFAP